MTFDELAKKRCLPCEGGIPPLSPEEVSSLLAMLPDWKLTSDGKRIRREWNAKHFVAGMEFIDKVAKLAEEEQHHPDLHLTEYRNLAIELWTHAVNGLTESDFIVAAKINLLPIRKS